MTLAGLPVAGASWRGADSAAGPAGSCNAPAAVTAAAYPAKAQSTGGYTAMSPRTAAVAAAALPAVGAAGSEPTFVKKVSEAFPNRGCSFHNEMLTPFNFVTAWKALTLQTRTKTE